MYDYIFLDSLISSLRKATEFYTPPLSETIIKEYGKDPFLILISCLLSLRAKDSMTIHVCRELFKKAQTPEQLLALPIADLEKILFRIGFYKNKAKILREVSQSLLTNFKGIVPSTHEELLTMKGVGRKTANLVLGMAFDIPALCVDIHVHRISNRLGLVKTKTPHETEIALAAILPQHYWIEWNRLIVMWGQNVCVPISPWCSRCVLKPICAQSGVRSSR